MQFEKTFKFMKEILIVDKTTFFNFTTQSFFIFIGVGLVPAGLAIWSAANLLFESLRIEGVPFFVHWFSLVISLWFIILSGIIAYLDSLSSYTVKNRGTGSFVSLRNIPNAHGDQSLCCICLDMFKETTDLVLLNDCRHAFHLRCLQAWLRQKRDCPYCRSSIGFPFKIFSNFAMHHIAESS